MSSIDRLSIPIHSTRDGGHLASALATAEEALSIYAGGEVDAVIGSRGQVYLLCAAQERIRRSEARLKELFDSIPDVIAVLDGQGEILALSPSIKTLLGHEPAALVGQRFMAFVHPEDRAALQQTWSDLADGKVCPRVARFRYKADDESWLRFEATVGLLPAEQTSRFVMNCRLAAELPPSGGAQALHDADTSNSISRMETSLAMVSHELRTPLTPVFLSLAMLQSEPSLTPFASTFEVMERNLRMQLRIIDELKQFVQVGHQKVLMTLEPVDAHAAVAFAVEICRDEIAKRGVVARLDLAATDCTVLADPLKLQQILWNLLQNAIKFSKPGGTIFVKSRSSAPAAFVLEIADEGAGIEPDFLPQVFEPFKQSSAPNSRKAGSLGLGMYIARGLAEAQRGTLTVTSDGLGKGCTFQLCLQCGRAESAGKVVPSQALAGQTADRLKGTFSEEPRSR
jgi:PAS domain S-box-containing protein